MGHDPQRAAGAYLGGELGRRQRERFEAHLLACEACWGEVQAARQGRALAESAREVAPQHLRDRVRATVEATPAGRPRWAVRWAPLAAAVTLIAAVAGLLLVDRQPTQPAPIAAAVASYQTHTPAWSGPAHPPPVQQVGDLRWRGSVLLTSNKAFSEWGQVFADDVLASAILDRLLHHCDVIAINGPSYRLKDRLKPSDGGGALE